MDHSLRALILTHEISAIRSGFRFGLQCSLAPPSTICYTNFDFRLNPMPTDSVIAPKREAALVLRLQQIKYGFRSIQCTRNGSSEIDPKYSIVRLMECALLLILMKEMRCVLLPFHNSGGCERDILLKCNPYQYERMVGQMDRDGLCPIAMRIVRSPFGQIQ